MILLKKIYYKKYSNRSYSISNVDLIIDRLFRSIKNGIYIDVGCNHPIKYNNTYLLYKRGWNGINIDSDSTSIKEFKKFRKNDYNVNATVSDTVGIKELYKYHDRSALNTLSKELVDSRANKPKNIIKKKTMLLNEIIEQSPFKNKKINLMSIDVEDHEYEVLKNFDFEKYKIDIIVSECLNIRLKKLEIYNYTLEFIKSSKIYNLLIKNNYNLINWVHSDLVFARKDMDI